MFAQTGVGRVVGQSTDEDFGERRVFDGRHGATGRRSGGTKRAGRAGTDGHVAHSSGQNGRRSRRRRVATGNDGGQRRSVCSAAAAAQMLHQHFTLLRHLMAVAGRR